MAPAKIIKRIELEMADITILDGPKGTTIQSDLADQDRSGLLFDSDHDYLDAIQVFENTVLQDHLAGVDVSAPWYREGLDRTLAAILANHP